MKLASVVGLCLVCLVQQAASAQETSRRTPQQQELLNEFFEYAGVKYGDNASEFIRSILRST